MLNENWKESFVYFWEIFTGIRFDFQSKILRSIIFIIILSGIIWAIFNFLKSDPNNSFANVYNKNDKDSDIIQVNVLTDQAKIISLMRNGVINVAKEMRISNRKLFGENKKTEDLEIKETVISDIKISSPDIEIKAIVLSGKYGKAVIDFGKFKGVILKNGDNLPGGSGKIINISSKGITLSWEGRKIFYSVKK